MNPRFVLLTALLVATPGFALVPPASAQGGAVDVSVYRVFARPDPVVNQTAEIVAVINTTGPSVVQVNFRYGDGNDLRPEPGSSFVIKNFSQAGSAEVSLGFRVPIERRGPQQIVVSAAGTSLGSDPDPTNNSLSFTTVFREPRLNLTFDHPATLDIVPGGEAVLRYFVRNDGNHLDNATPVLKIDTPHWIVESYGPLPPIPPGQSVTGFLLVRNMAPQARDFVNLSLNLTAVSQLGGAGSVTVQAPMLHPNETAYQRRPTVQLLEVPLTMQVFPGEERGLEFLVNNTGWHPQVFRLTPTIVGKPEGWNATMRVPLSWPANLSTPRNDTGDFAVFVPSNESVLVQVNVTRAATAPNATATLRIEVNSTDGDRINAVAGGDYRASALVQISDAGPDLTVGLANDPSLLYQGDPVPFRVEVRNAGRANATNSTLRLELRDNLRAIEEVRLQVPPVPANLSAFVEWMPNTASLRGTYAILGRIEVNASEVDRNPANDTFRREIHFRAPVVTVRAPDAIDVTPGGRFLLSASEGGFSVENLGDRDEFVHATLTSTVGWLNAEWRILIPAGGRQALPVDLDVPLVPGAREAVATFTASVDGRPRFSASTMITVRVDDQEAPVLTLESPTAPTLVGQETRLAVRAIDASGIRRAELILQTPGGERVALPLQRDAERADVYGIRYTPVTAGVYGLEFRVEDASDRVASATLGNRTWTVLPRAYTGLRPVNFGEGAFVGRSPLVFAEATPGTTRSVQVDVGEGFRPIVAPYEVQLPQVEGRRTVLLRATSNDGTIWEGRWNVTVDLTPPTLADPVTRDAGSGRVDLTVRAEGAREVVARFQTETGPVEVPLTGRGGGLFGATVNAPASWNAVTFVAKDPAGNEGSAVLEAPGGNGTPGPALGIVLLALVALALARRRAA